MIGTDALIKGARANGAPNEAAVCRAMKSSKESIVGVVIAVEDFMVSLYFKTGRKKKKHKSAHALPHRHLIISSKAYWVATATPP